MSRSTTPTSASPTFLEKGKRVAVRPEDSDWILAHVIRQISTNMWEVEDAEDDEDNPGKKK